MAHKENSVFTKFDPITPPGGGEEVLRGLPHGLHIVIRNNGHPIGNAEQCIGKMMGAFIDIFSPIREDFLNGHKG
jgi:hypothetical protein